MFSGLSPGSNPTEEKMRAYDRQTAKQVELNELPLHYATDLTEGGVLAHIQLHDQLYVLRITHAGKLILTK